MIYNVLIILVFQRMHVGPPNAKCDRRMTGKMIFKRKFPSLYVKVYVTAQWHHLSEQRRRPEVPQSPDV